MASFLSNLFKLTTGTMIAQVISILLVPVITRLYSPEYFGVAQLFLSIAALIVVVSSLSYHFAIMVSEKDEDSMNVLALSVVCILGVSTISGAFFAGFGDMLAVLLNAPLIANYLILLPVFVVFNSLFLILNEWFSRKVRYGILAGGIVVSTVATRAFQVGGGLALVSPLGLILGSVVGFGLADLFMLRNLKQDIPLLKSVTVRRMRNLAVRYRNFSFYGSAGSLANSLSWELPAFMLAFFFNPTVVGYYALAVVAVRMPMTMVGTSVSQVFFQKASEEKNLTGGVQGVVREIHTRLISVGIFPFIAFMILSEDLFTFIFGADWLIAGTYARILAPWFFAVFLISPISSLFAVLERQRAYLAFEVMTLCTWTLIFLAGGAYGNPLVTLTLFSIGGVLMWGSKSAYLIKESGAGFRESTASLVRHLLISIAVSLPLAFGVFLDLPFLLLIGVAGVTTVAYYLIIFFTDTLVRREIMGIVGSYVPAKHIDWIRRF